MELSHNNRVLFDPTSHSYLLDGSKLLMGCTELMKKHNLGADYDGIPEATLKKAAEVGTAIHREIQAYDDGELSNPSPLIEDYKRLLRTNHLKSVANEYGVSDYELVASAIDKVYETKGGKAVLVDIKTTQKLHRRAVEWQLGCYKVWFERQNPGIEVAYCAALWIDKKSKRINDFITIDPVSEEEVNALLDCERNGQLYVDGNETPGAELVLTDAELTTYVSAYDSVLAFKAKVDEAQAKLKEFDKKILEYLQKNNIDEMVAPHGIRFKVKKGYESTRVDITALKEKFPAVYAKVTKKSTTSASLLVSKKEEEWK